MNRNDMTNIKRLGPDRWKIRFKYKVRLTDELRVVERVVRGTLADAQAARDKLKVEAREGSLSGREDASRAEHDVVAAYEEGFLTHRRTRGSRRGRALAHSTLQQGELALKNHILPSIGAWKVHEIRAADLEQLIDEWSHTTKPGGQPYSNATINQWIKILKLFFEYICRMSSIPTSPAAGLLPLIQPEPPGWALTAEQVKRFLDGMRAHRPQYYAMVLMGFSTGARFGELSALHWEDIDEEHDVIHFAHSQYEGVRRRLTKTHKYIQRPLTPAMREALRHHLAWMRVTEHPACDSPIVFPARVNPAEARYNGYMSLCALSGAMTYVADEVGLPRLTPHDMRRTFNTLMLESGVTPTLLKAMTGHSTDRMMLHYAHISNAHKATAVERMMSPILGDLEDDLP